MQHSRIKNYFRPVFEARAAALWLAADLYCLGLHLALRGDSRALPLIAMFGLLMAGYRARQAVAIWDFKIALAGFKIGTLSANDFERQKAGLEGDLFLGWGFRWEQSHAQLAHDILKQNSKEIYPPDWYLKLAGVTEDPRKLKGLQWIQGLGEEADIRIPMKALEGHTGILAITGAIKTTLFRLMVYQFVAQGDVVFVIDPKGDYDLKRICKEVPARLGRPKAFAQIHPAFPNDSVRYDAFAAWGRTTEVASRIRMILSVDEEDSFVNFVFMVVTNITGCLKRIGKRTSMSNLLEYAQSLEAAELLCAEVLQKYLTEEIAHFEALLAERTRSLESESKRPSKGPQIGSPRLKAMIELFKSNLPSSQRPREIDGLIAALEADRTWWGKMIIQLTPTLTKLTSGDLGAMLSPDYEDVTDPRPILNARKIIEGGYVAYFGLDALSDSSVASSIAAVVLADLASTAGEIYNYDIPNSGGVKPRRVHVIIDEWGDVVCDPVIHGANKGRGAGLIYYLAGQTVSDIVAKFGDRAKALRTLGNLNNLIVGATNDEDTLKIVQSKIGETTIRQYSASSGVGQKTEDTGLEFSANRGTSISEREADLVSTKLLMGLPDLQYFGVVNRAEVVKGRIPVLTLPEGVN